MQTGGDFKSNWRLVQTMPPAAHTATANGATVDTQNDKRAAFDVNVGLFTDGTHTIKFQDSDDGSTWADIAAADLAMPDDAPAGVVVGATLVIDDAAEDNQHYVVQYLGIKRYLRAVRTLAGTTTGAVFGISVVAGESRYLGVSQLAS